MNFLAKYNKFFKKYLGLPYFFHFLQANHKRLFMSILTPDIKNIIFDLGGVILNIRPERITEDMPQKRIRRFHTVFKTLYARGLFDDFEKGLLSPNAFRSAVKKEINEPLSDAEFDSLWNRLLLDYPPQNIEILMALAKNRRIFLLSNTNIIHARSYMPQFKKEFGIDFQELFETVWLSYEIGLRKPDPSIFKYAWREAKLQPEETLFIDDSQENTAAAQALCIKSICMTRNAGLQSLFPHLIS